MAAGPMAATHCGRHAFAQWLIFDLKVNQCQAVDVP